MLKIWIWCVFIILGFIVFYKNIKAEKSWDILENNGNTCGMEGSAKNKADANANRLKNRWHVPKDSDFDDNFNWEIIYDGEEDSKKFSQTKAGKLKGYVAHISKSHAESCNCNHKDEDFYDYHINLVPDIAYLNDKTQHLILEITPRIRAIMKSKNQDWSFNALKKLRHQYIEFEGWIFYDWDHGDKAYLRTGDSLKSWQATCWELHPVTGFKILDE